MKRVTMYLSLAGLLVALSFSAARVNATSVFNGAGENQRGDLGYYYAVTGGTFVNGQTADGTANGRTIRFIEDEPAWGRPASQLNQWQKDAFFNDTAGVALTLKNGATIVYDNNGLQDGSFAPNYYNAQAGAYPAGGHGAVVLYSMSNNFDWIYAGYMKLDAPTTFTSLTGYFVTNAPGSGDNGAVDYGFNPNSPEIGFRMNIFSSFAGTDPDVLEVTNTGSFTGDVFSTDHVGGTFSFADTGYDRVGSTGLVSSIYELTYSLDSPITLQDGEYFFSHDAVIVPEPLTMITVFAAFGGIGAYLRKRTPVRA